MEQLLNQQTDDILHLDVCLDELSPHTGAMELLKTLRPHWRAEDIQLKVFTEGITNQLLGCWMDGDPAVVLVRIFGRMTELFVDRQKELETLKLLHSHSCGPKVYCSFHNGICYQFLTGEALDDVLLRQPSVYRLVAMEMGKIHSIKPKSCSTVEPVLWTKLQKYLKLLQTCGTDFLQQSSQLDLPSVDVLISETDQLKRHLNRVKSPTVLCHNDLLTKNIIYNAKEGVNNVDYSLYPSRELQFDWISTYLQSVRDRTQVNTQVTQTDVQTLYVHVCKFSLLDGRLSDRRVST
ncbi:Ethanolamine kinase 2 [Bagarius yarrelli]|uniref:ethanolamine kinase n=1 Tax=Bagarius yarrelli TaxID=175774 RepID=A0A556VBX2_BAGYA|nr:Ethanolamine kinase 2 [Bagarius yarrelli]